MTTEWQFNSQQLEPPSLACNINVFFFLTYLATTPIDGTPLMNTLDHTIYQGSIYLTYHTTSCQRGEREKKNLRKTLVSNLVHLFGSNHSTYCAKGQGEGLGSAGGGYAPLPECNFLAQLLTVHSSHSLI